MMNRKQRDTNRRTSIKLRDQVLLDNTADEMADIAAEMRATRASNRLDSMPAHVQTPEKAATGLQSLPSTPR